MKIPFNLNKIKKLKSFSLLIIPDESGISAKSRKFTMATVLIIVMIYTLLVLAIGVTFLNVTPLGKLFGFNKRVINNIEYEQIELLNKRILFISREFLKLKTANENLKQAIFLGDSTLIDSLNKKITPLKRNVDTVNIDYKIKGNIYFIINKLLNSLDIKKETVLFERPVNGFISRAFDYKNGHLGLDYVVKIGTPIHASSGGYVIFSDYTVKDGYMLIIYNSKNYLTVYKHCSVLLKKIRETVLSGEIIALSGNSGLSTTGPHLHFEIWKDGKPINPQTKLINN